jgi:hypothetical protein
MRVLRNQEGLKLKLKFLTYADDVNIVGENIDTIRKNTKAILYAGKDVNLKVNTEKTKNMLMPRYKIANKSSEFIYLQVCSLQGFGKKARRKETSRKTEA